MAAECGEEPASSLVVVKYPVRGKRGMSTVQTFTSAGVQREKTWDLAMSTSPSRSSSLLLPMV